VTETETGWIRLKRIVGALNDAAMCSPRAVEPYAVRRKKKGGPVSNDIPCRRAVRLLARADPAFARLASWLERRSDGLYVTERRCPRCGLFYEPLDDSNLCPICVLEERKKAQDLPA